jgi:hypothetical protein
MHEHIAARPIATGAMPAGMAPSMADQFATVAG